MKKQGRISDSPEPISPIIVFLMRHWKNLLFASVAALLALFGLLQLADRRETKQKLDYMQPPLTVSALTKDPALISNLTAIISRHKELAPKYEGLLAQALLLQQDLVQARTYATPLMARNRQSADPYHRFAEGSLLIEEGRHAEALQQAKELLNALDRRKNPLLFGHLLLRIALLEDQPKNWAALLNSLEEEPALRLFASSFEVGHTSLADFARSHSIPITSS
ncbi:MAG: hypothetical protein JSR80_06840 [Verrucomicrobia bacterium]|nr:hypothetical protein [Verrucomicrobiota bacterium]